MALSFPVLFGRATRGVQAYLGDWAMLAPASVTWEYELRDQALVRTVPRSSELTRIERASGSDAVIGENAACPALPLELASDGLELVGPLRAVDARGEAYGVSNASVKLVRRDEAEFRLVIVRPTREAGQLRVITEAHIGRVARRR